MACNSLEYTSFIPRAEKEAGGEGGREERRKGEREGETGRQRESQENSVAFQDPAMNIMQRNFVIY